MITFFKTLSLVFKFWSVVETIVSQLEHTPEEERAELSNNILVASRRADQGNTSDYEDIIRRGRME